MTHKFSFSFRELARRGDTRIESAVSRDASRSDLATFSQHRLRLALGPFRRRVRHVEAVLRDLNGPRGGVDKACLVTLHLEPSDLLVVESRADSSHAAIADAARRAGAALRRRLQRRRAVARNRWAAQPWREATADRSSRRQRTERRQLVG
jgi:hypothetical protein